MERLGIIVTTVYVIMFVLYGVFMQMLYLQHRRKLKRTDQAAEFFELCGKLFPEKIGLLTHDLFEKMIKSKQPIYKYLRVFLDSELSIVG
jgi:hypothetical protein